MSKNFELLQRAEQAHTIAIEADRNSLPGQPPFENDSAPPVREAAQDNGLANLPEALRNQLYTLVQRLIALAHGGKLCVVFSGTERGTGCTWVAAHVGQVLAAVTRKSVCLIDTHLSSRGLDAFFNVNNHRGFTDAVAQNGPVDDFLHQVKDNLWLLTAGSAPMAPTSLLSADGMRACIAQLRTAFNYVIIDSPPLNASAGSLAVASAADGIVLVLKANSSRRETAQKVLQESAAANIRLLGAILNQRTFPVPHRIYRHL